MRDVNKFRRNINKAPYLNEIWAIGAAQVRYRDDGTWYATLSRFPAALIDAHGYVRFETEQEYKNSPHLNIGVEISVRKPGISEIPGYKVVDESDETSRLDVNELLARLGRRTAQSRKHKTTSSIEVSDDLL
jgi:hypothetical protein